MRMKTYVVVPAFLLPLFIFLYPVSGFGWHNETHLSIAKAAGYRNWFNATGADMAKLKAGCNGANKEEPNHYSSNPRGKVIDAKMVLKQAEKYDNPRDREGHLYGAIVASLREYRKANRAGKYGEFHLAFCAHYVGDLSMPFHNTKHEGFAKINHAALDGIVEDEVMDNIHEIIIYPIRIASEKELASEIARIANISTKLGYQLIEEKRLLTKKEAYKQLSHSASLFKAILDWNRSLKP